MMDRFQTLSDKVDAARAAAKAGRDTARYLMDYYMDGKTIF